VSKAQVTANGGWSLLQRYKGSLQKTLMAIYEEFNWEEAFAKSNGKFDINAQRFLMNQIASKLSIFITL
jgi:hypothetical protein